MSLWSSAKNHLSQFKLFVRYCVVGVIGTLVDVGSLYIFIEYMKMPLLIATTLAFLLAVINNFVLNKIWTFGNSSKNYKKLFIKFLIVSVVGLILTDFLMYVQVEMFAIWYIYAKLITSGVVLTWNFLANKYWTFSVKEVVLRLLESYEYELSIIIPAYNEKSRIKGTLLAVHDFIEEQNIDAEIIVVDDGSSDNTSEIVMSKQAKIPNLAVIRLEKNAGKGNAVRVGVEAALGRYILFTDADNSTPIEEHTNLYEAITGGYDIAIGSRYLRDSHVEVKQPFFRVMLGRIGNLLIRVFLVSDIKDTQCGFKLFRNPVAKQIFHRQKVKRWGFDMEMIAIAQLLEYKVVEVPVSWFNSVDTRLRPVRDALKTFTELIYIKLNLMSGRYED